jgi:hypothetical protein
MLPDETEDEILFFGGKDYVALFCELTKDVKSRRTVFYSSAEPPAAPRLHAGEIRHNDQKDGHCEGATPFFNGPFDSDEAQLQMGCGRADLSDNGQASVRPAGSPGK